MFGVCLGFGLPRFHQIEQPINRALVFPMQPCPVPLEAANRGGEPELLIPSHVLPSTCPSTRGAAGLVRLCGHSTEVRRGYGVVGVTPHSPGGPKETLDLLAVSPRQSIVDL
jgi:hypothetical protein